MSLTCSCPVLCYPFRPDLTSEERETVIHDLVREITALWQTDELRRQKPTPVDGELQAVQASADCSNAACW